jgi:hypothetical protein
MPIAYGWRRLYNTSNQNWIIMGCLKGFDGLDLGYYHYICDIVCLEGINQLCHPSSFSFQFMWSSLMASSLKNQLKH